MSTLYWLYEDTFCSSTQNKNYTKISYKLTQQYHEDIQNKQKILTKESHKTFI